MAVLDLECHQIDIKTAFLNALKTGMLRELACALRHREGVAAPTDLIRFRETYGRAHLLGLVFSPFTFRFLCRIINHHCYVN